MHEIYLSLLIKQEMVAALFVNSRFVLLCQVDLPLISLRPHKTPHQRHAQMEVELSSTCQNLSWWCLMQIWESVGGSKSNPLCWGAAFRRGCHHEQGPLLPEFCLPLQYPHKASQASHAWVNLIWREEKKLDLKVSKLRSVCTKL